MTEKMILLFVMGIFVVCLELFASNTLRRTLILFIFGMIVGLVAYQNQTNIPINFLWYHNIAIPFHYLIGGIFICTFFFTIILIWFIKKPGGNKSGGKHEEDNSKKKQKH